MSEQGDNRSFWARIFGGYADSAREKMVLEYVIHRINDGASLKEAVEDDYVRRNVTPGQIHDILSDPRLVEAARERLQRAFASGEFDPNRRPG